jgi:hypothetical protein
VRKLDDDKQLKLKRLARSIYDALAAHPDGLTIDQIRSIVVRPGEKQEHLNKRLRELYPMFVIERSRRGADTVYRLTGPRPAGSWDYAHISKTLRAAVIHRDGERCQMCGRTVADDHVRLHVDHKIPREWGGPTELENLRALCSACNEGKKNYFASFDARLMTAALAEASVHARIAQLLRLKQGDWVHCDLIEFVANFNDYQTDWPKRLRELRYSCVGLVIDTRQVRLGKRKISEYRLKAWKELPRNVTDVVRAFERERAQRNRARRA